MILEKVGLRIEEYANQYNISENSLRKWIQEDKESTFGKISTDTLSLELNIEKNIVFKNGNIHIELREGFDKEYLKKIVEVLINAK